MNTLDRSESHAVSGLLVGALVLLAGLSPGLRAAPQTSLVAGLEARASDNILRTESDTRDDVMYTPQLSIGFADQRGMFDLSSDYTYRARFFQRDSFTDDQVVTGTTGLSVNLVPERYTLQLSHDRAQALQQPGIVDTPQNQFELDTLSIGQSLVLFPSERQDLVLSSNLSRVSGSRPQDSSDRLSLSARFTRALDSRNSLQLSASRLSVDFETQGLADFDRESYLVRLLRDGRNWNGSVGVGYNTVERDGFGSRGGELLDLSFTWTPAPRHSLGFSASRRFTDQAALAPTAIPDPDRPLQEAEFDGQVFEDTSLSASYSYRTERFTARLGGSRGLQDFEGSTREFERRTLTLSLSYSVSRRLSLSGTVRYSEIDFSDFGATGGRTDEIEGVQAGASWTLGERTSVSLTLSEDRRSSSADLGGGPTFDERSVSLTLRRRLI